MAIDKKIEDNDQYKDFRFLLMITQGEEYNPTVETRDSGLFPGRKECTLESNGERVEFLLTNPGADSYSDQRLALNLDYFDEKYIAQIGRDKQMVVKEYSIPLVKILDAESGRCDVVVQAKDIERTTLGEYWRKFRNDLAEGNYIEAWIDLNSIYNQLKDEQSSPIVRTALNYLEELQRIVTHQQPYLTPDDLEPISDTVYPIDPTRVEIEDPNLTEKTVEVGIHTDDIRRAVFFDPAIYLRPEIYSEVFRNRLDGNRLELELPWSENLFHVVEK